MNNPSIVASRLRAVSLDGGKKDNVAETPPRRHSEQFSINWREQNFNSLLRNNKNERGAENSPNKNNLNISFPPQGGERPDKSDINSKSCNFFSPPEKLTKLQGVFYKIMNVLTLWCRTDEWLEKENNERLENALKEKLFDENGKAREDMRSGVKESITDQELLDFMAHCPTFKAFTLEIFANSSTSMNTMSYIYKKSRPEDGSRAELNEILERAERDETLKRAEQDKKLKQEIYDSRMRQAKILIASMKALLTPEEIHEFIKKVLKPKDSVGVSMEKDAVTTIIAAAINHPKISNETLNFIANNEFKEIINNLPGEDRKKLMEATLENVD